MAPGSLSCGLAGRPYTIIENSLLECKNLSIYEKMILIMFRKCAGKSGRIYPGVSTLAEWSGCSKRQVQRTIRNLEKKGLISVTRRHRGTSLYTVSKLVVDDGILSAAGKGKGRGSSKVVNIKGDCQSPPGDSESPQGDGESSKKYKSKNIPLKKSSSSGQAHELARDNTKGPSGTTKILVEEWEELFCEKLPYPRSGKMVMAADYMLYLFKKGEMDMPTRPGAYVKAMVRQGFPETGWPSFEDRRLAALEKEERQRRDDQREDMERKRLMEERKIWEALGESERQKWILAGRENPLLKFFSDSMKGFLSWQQSSMPNNPIK